MEAAASEGEIGKTAITAERSKRPKRQMKTPFQLEVLEKTYATEAYPSEATRAELSAKLSLTDRQLQMWFCHRRLKDKKEELGLDKKEEVGVDRKAVAPKKNRASVPSAKKGLAEPLREEQVPIDPRSGDGSGSGSSSYQSGSASGSGSGSSEFDNADDIPNMAPRYYDSPTTLMHQKVISCVESQLGEPIRQDGPILGVEFDDLPPGAFGAPIVPSELQGRYRDPYDSKLSSQYDAKLFKAASSVEPHTRNDVLPSLSIYDHVPDGPGTRGVSLMREDGHLLPEHGAEGQGSGTDSYFQMGRKMHLCSSSMNAEFYEEDDDNLHLQRKRKGDEAHSGREVQANEKKIRKEIEKQEHIRRKREEQLRKEMERLDRQRRKDEQRIMREQQKQEEKFQREERREMERREKLMQRELLRATRRKQKEELRREKDEARQKAAMERAAARRIAKEYMELIEDERLELMELAASGKGLPSILSLDYDTLENLDSFREALCQFPPQTVLLRTPFAVKPWLDSDKNIGDLLMVWKFCVTFSDVLGLWPFTLEEFSQAFHDHDSRLLGEIHIAILKLIIKDIEDVVRTPSGGPGTNQYSAINPEGGHPHIVEGAYLWGFDIRNWQKHLNPLTWPEILRQLALAAGFGPQLKKKTTDRASLNDNDQNKGCQEIISTLRNGSAAEHAAAKMQEKGSTLQRKSRGRLTPGTVKFAAYHVLALEGSKGLNVIELSDKIQKSGLRDLKTSKTPEASISVALSRDPVIFERIAPSTYCVRPAFRKSPADAESVIAAAKEKIQRYANGFLVGQNADDEERDDDSESDVAEGAEIDNLVTPPNAAKSSEYKFVGSALGNRKDKLPVDATRLVGSDIGSVPDQEFEVDESRLGEAWVLGLTEGDYSDLSVEERINSLVALVGVANEGNSIRVILEERMDAAVALKKQMWTEAQLDKRRMREEIVINKVIDPCNAVSEGGVTPLLNEHTVHELLTSRKDDSFIVEEGVYASVDNVTQDTVTGQFISPAQQTAHMTERSRLQLKSYIGHRAEEMYVCRSLPLGQDRRRNRYWQFAASDNNVDPGSGRIFVETQDGNWRLLDSVEAFDNLLASLDTRGTRESHLHIMLQKVESCFKECIKSSFLSASGCDNYQSKSGQEAVKIKSGAAYGSFDGHGTNSGMLEPSWSFRIDIGRDESEINNFMKRHEDLRNWISKECINSSVFHGIAYEEKRCTPVLEVCDICLSTYENEGVCSLCDQMYGDVFAQGNLSEQLVSENRSVDKTDGYCLDSSPLRIRVIKAILTLIEATVPSEALHPSWTEERRRTWASEMHESSSIDGIMQILTQFESAIRRNHLSADFETTEELLCCYDSSRVPSNLCDYSASVTHLPWIPNSTAAIALRLLELDESIHYDHIQKVDPIDKKEFETPDFGLRFDQQDMIKAETHEPEGHGSAWEENCGHIRSAPGSTGFRQMTRGRGGRSCGKLHRGVVGSNSSSKRRIVKADGTPSENLLQQSLRMPGQSHGRGRRTVRRRRSDNNVTAEPSVKNAANKPRISAGEDEDEDEEDMRDFASSRNILDENDDSSSSCSEAGEADENVYEEDRHGFERWDAAASNRSGEMLETNEEDADYIVENGYEEEDEGDGMQMNYDDDYSEEVGEGARDEASDSAVSGDYSD